VSPVANQPSEGSGSVASGTPNVLLIAGTTSRGHLAENLAAADLALSDDEIASLTNAFS
jgi:aryl-alcohol dehydrogenase-like predicted oxidoreductase